MPPPSFPLRPTLHVLLLALLAVSGAGGTEILAKSRMERCALDSGAGARLSCDQKIILDLAVPSGSSGGEASLVTKVVEVEQNDTQATIRDPPVITINKTTAYVEYALTYHRVMG